MGLENIHLDFLRKLSLCLMSKDADKKVVCVHQTLDSLGGEMQPQSCFMEISVENHDKQQYMVPGSSDSKLALVWLVNCGVQNNVDF